MLDLKLVCECYFWSIQLRAKMIIDSDFAIIIYIPQYDKKVNRMFMFWDVGVLIVANIWEICPYINFQEI